MMQGKKITIPMLVVIAVLCLSVLSFSTTASGNANEPDAVVGAIPELYGKTGGNTFEITTSVQRGGSVLAEASDSAAGSTVSFTVTPYGGYETASIAAISAAGTQLEVKCDSDGSYYFVMPEENVVIDVSFQYLRVS